MADKSKIEWTDATWNPIRQAAGGVPFFFKQWGEWADAEDWPSEMQEHLELIGRADGNSVRVGKARAGRLLDGVEHNAMPER